MKIALTRTMMLVAVVAMMALVSAGCGGESAKSSSSTKTGADQPADVQKSQTPLVPKPQMIDWCKEHGVPESVC